MSKLSGPEGNLSNQVAQSMLPTELEARFDRVLQELRVEGLQAPLPALQEDLPLDQTDEDAYSSKMLSRRLPGKDQTGGGLGSYNYSDRTSSNDAYGGKYIDDGEDMVTVNDSISDVDAHESGTDMGVAVYGSGELNGWSAHKGSPQSPPVFTQGSQRPSSLVMQPSAFQEDAPLTLGDEHQHANRSAPAAMPSSDHSMAIMEARARRNARAQQTSVGQQVGAMTRLSTDDSGKDEGGRDEGRALAQGTRGQDSVQGMLSRTVQRHSAPQHAPGSEFRRLHKMPVCERLYEMALQKREEKRQEQEKAAARELEEIQRMRAAASSKKKAANRSGSPLDVSYPAAGSSYFEYLYSEAEIRQQRRKQLEMVESSEARAAKECTFHPSINTSGFEASSVNRAAGSLYARWKVMRAAQEEKAQKARQQALEAEAADLTFHPTTNSKYKPRHEFGSFWHRHDQLFLPSKRADDLFSHRSAHSGEAAEHRFSRRSKSTSGSAAHTDKWARGEESAMHSGRSFLQGHFLGQNPRRHPGGGSDMDILEQLRFLRGDTPPSSSPTLEPPVAQRPRSEGPAKSARPSRVPGDAHPTDLPGKHAALGDTNRVASAAVAQLTSQRPSLGTSSSHGFKLASKEAPAAMQGASGVAPTDASFGRRLSFSSVLPPPFLEGSVYASAGALHESPSQRAAASPQASRAHSSHARMAARAAHGTPVPTPSQGGGDVARTLHDDRAVRDAWREGMADERVLLIKARARSHGISPQSLHYAKRRLEKHLKELFRELDADRDGLLARDQVVTALRRLCVFHPVASGSNHHEGMLECEGELPRGSAGRRRRNLQQEAEEGRLMARIWALVGSAGRNERAPTQQLQAQGLEAWEGGVAHGDAAEMTEDLFVRLLLEVLGTSVHKASPGHVPGSSQPADARRAAGMHVSRTAPALSAGASSTLALSLFSAFGSVALGSGSVIRAQPSMGEEVSRAGGDGSHTFDEVVRDLCRTARRNLSWAGIGGARHAGASTAEARSLSSPHGALAGTDASASPPRRTGGARGEGVATRSSGDATRRHVEPATLGGSTPLYDHSDAVCTDPLAAHSAHSDHSAHGVPSGPSGVSVDASPLLARAHHRREGACEVSHLEQSSREWGLRAQAKMERLRQQLDKEEMKECSFHPDVHPVVPHYLRLQKKALHLVKLSRRNARRRRHRRDHAGHRQAARRHGDPRGGASASEADTGVEGHEAGEGPGGDTQTCAGGQRRDGDEDSADSEEAECTFKPHIRQVPESSKASFAHAKAPLFDQTVTRMRQAYEARVALMDELAARVHVPLSQRRRYLRVAMRKGAASSGKTAGARGTRGRAPTRKRRPGVDQPTAGDGSGGGGEEGSRAAEPPGGRRSPDGRTAVAAPRKPVLYIDVLLSRGRKGRIGVCEGDTPQELASNFAKIYGLSDVVRSHLTELVQRHMEENRLTFAASGAGVPPEEPPQAANSSPPRKHGDGASFPSASLDADVTAQDTGSGSPHDMHWDLPVGDAPVHEPAEQAAEVAVHDGGELSGVPQRPYNWALEGMQPQSSATTKNSPGVAKGLDACEVRGLRQSAGLLQSSRHFSSPASTPFRKATPQRGGPSSTKKMPFATTPLGRDAELAAAQAAAAATAAVSLHQLSEGASLDKKEGGRSPKPLWQPRQPTSS